MATIPDNKIDLIVTDPPYLINYKTNWRKEKHKFSNVIKNDNNPELIKEYIKECYRILKDDTAIYIFCSFDGDIVFDGFMGSGTTALAALETDRHFIGAEIDGYYFGIAEERIKNHNAQLSLFDEV